MFAQVPLFPEQASTNATQVDALFFFLLAVTGAAGLLVTVLIVRFAVRYRRRTEGERTPRILGSVRLETSWAVVPVPVNTPVKLILTSEDVIHDFFVPAFRTKIDVLPGRYVQTWFQATKPGRYDIFCAQYCGTNHSGMVGEVVVLSPNDYADWLNSH